MTDNISNNIIEETTLLGGGTMTNLYFYPEEQDLFSAKPRLSDEINESIDASFKPIAPRQYLGASSLGDACSRKLQYQFRGLQETFSGKQNKVFEIGNVLEGLTANWLRQAGFELETLNSTTQKQFEFQQANGQIRGHIDGIIRQGRLRRPAIPTALGIQNHASCAVAGV